MKLNEYGKHRATIPLHYVIRDELVCPCGQPIHLVRYIGCKPNVPLYWCEYGELHEGEDPDARK